jgi:hypothetical protein
MLVMVLIDLAAICKKRTENAGVPDALRVKAREFGEEFNPLLVFPTKVVLEIEHRVEMG